MDSSISALMMLVFILGIKHGFEPDHLAVIDGMTRSISPQNRAKYSGCFFSLGHGFIVIVLATLIGLAQKTQSVPVFFQATGIWISIIFLIGFGIYNTYLALTPSDQVQLAGPKSMLFNYLVQSNKQLSFMMPFLIGMLFSLSFDTLSMTTAFAISGFTLGGPWLPTILAIIFMVGMVIIDGLNGFIVANIITYFNRRSQWVSRMINFVIGGFSLMIGIYYLLAYL